ncbi:predicted protein [Naegleria gruberi]|uniref:Predicted protein n=1 Tax=Naegleria gruberi TaxID=5762 RepID=D2VQR5_NAEGR|nr:uncharacterized protein NAEGRDRAFT_71319 [Naegleria gruberi]EFC40691.1 predicted protein [Naegleria gruberi]|eukprot:XP_002673435.1 predicted protein [Naegleria gruberi strain NEG-M]
MPATIKTIKSRKNCTNYFINYDREFFEQQQEKKTKTPKEKVSKGRVVSSRGIKKSRKSNISKKFREPVWVKRVKAHQTKVQSIRSFKPNPIDRAEFDNCLKEMSLRTGKPFNSDTEVYEYLERRWNEFSFDAVKVLCANLQPGDVKWGYKLHLGTISYAILDRILCLNHNCKKEIIDIEQTINREKVPTRIFKYHFMKECGFPKFKSSYDWTFNLLFPDEEKSYLQICEYTAMTLVCNDYDNRVYVNWEMSCHSMKCYDNFDFGYWMISN